MDSSYASYRWLAWTRWPTTGAADIYGSAAAYHHEIGQILGSGVPLDKANLYFDARLSHKHPTIEVRVADVCLVCRRYRPAGSPGPRPRENRSTALLDHLRPVLKEQGEINAVEFLLLQVQSRGTGAAVQRASYARRPSTREVVADAIRFTRLPATPFETSTAVH